MQISGNCLAGIDASTAFDTANKLYEQGKFPEAASTYEKILKAGTAAPELYFNLGNAWFKSGHTGRAIVAYQRAGQRTPRDPDVRANLKFARNQVQGPTLRATRWQQALETLNLNEWAGLTSAGIWITFLSLTAMQLRFGSKSVLRNMTIVAAGATVALGACLAVALATASNLAVVIAPEVTVRVGPLEESKPAFTAHDGAELRVLDSKNDWLQVTDGNRNIGWLKHDAVAQTSGLRK